jgi:hypothetical protein
MCFLVKLKVKETLGGKDELAGLMADANKNLLEMIQDCGTREISEIKGSGIGGDERTFLFVCPTPFHLLQKILFRIERIERNVMDIGLEQMNKP